MQPLLQQAAIGLMRPELHNMYTRYVASETLKLCTLAAFYCQCYLATYSSITESGILNHDLVSA